MRKNHEKEVLKREGFMSSLCGWSPTNTGRDIFVASGTCEWLKTHNEFHIWFDNITYGTYLWLADAGQGKTHLARASATYIRQKRPTDIVLSFFCTKHDEYPAIWEYFTWALLHEKPEWFSAVPQQYHDRTAESTRLGYGDFVEIWKALRESTAPSTFSIWLVIDNLESCGAEAFLAFWRSVEELRRVQTKSTAPSLILLKLLYTSTITPAMSAVVGGASRYYVSSLNVEADIAAWVDSRLNVCIRTSNVQSIKNSLERLKAEIKANARAFWPFAKHAVDEVEMCVGRNAALESLSYDGPMPRTMESQLSNTLLSMRQSIGPQRYLYPIIALLSSQDLGPALDVLQLRDALGALYDENEIRNLDLEQMLRTQCGGLLTVESDGLIYISHYAMAMSLKGRSSPERLNANMAYLCMTYLMKSCFKRPFFPPPKPGDVAKSFHSSQHPFYAYAAEFWSLYLTKAGKGQHKLADLFRRFVLVKPPQWRTYQSWLALTTGADQVQQIEAFGRLPLDYILMKNDLAPVLRIACPPPNHPSAQSTANTRDTFGFLDCSLPQMPSIVHLRGFNPLSLLRKIVALPSLHQPRPRKQHSLPLNWVKIRNSAGDTPLIAAARSKSHEFVKYIIQCGANVNERSIPSRETPLLALYSRWRAKNVVRDAIRINITRELLTNGADPNLGDSMGCRPLHQACMSGLGEAVKLLLEYGALPEVADIAGNNIWGKACESRDIGIVRELVMRGVDVDAPDCDEYTALAYFISTGQTELVTLILPQADINLRNRDGSTPLHVALKHIGLDGGPSHELLQILLAQPLIKVDAVKEPILAPDQPTEPLTPLLMAIQKQDLRSMEMLLQAGASPGHVPRVPQLPLHEAVRLGNPDIVLMLLSYHAPINEFLIDNTKSTALSVAVSSSNLALVELLLRNGADPTIEDGLDLPNTAHLVMDHTAPNVDILRLLLESPLCPDLNASPNVAGTNARQHILIRACKHRDIKLVQMLLDHGVDLSDWLESREEPSPLHEAVRAGDLELCKLLFEAEPRLLDLQVATGGWPETPLHMACAEGRTKIVKFLLEAGADTKRLVYHAERSSLLLACESNNYGTVKAILDADPSMVNVPNCNGCTPLIESTLQGNLRITKELLKAGAELAHQDDWGQICVSPSLFDWDAIPVVKTLKLLIDHGLDLNRPYGGCGRTPFSTVLSYAEPGVIQWALKQGGDPARCGLLPAETDYWWTALHYLMDRDLPEIIDTFLELRRNHLAEKDWLGDNALGFYSQKWSSYRTRLFWLCEDMKKETGRDLFLELLREPNVTGYTPLEYAMGAESCAIGARPQVAQRALRLLDRYLEKPVRSILTHLLRRTAGTLRCSEEAVIIPLMTLDLSGFEIVEACDGKPLRKIVSSDYRCTECRDVSADECYACPICEKGLCVECAKKPMFDSGKCEKGHRWFKLKLDANLSPQSPEIQKALELMRLYLLSETEGKTVEEAEPDKPSSVADDVSEEQRGLQSSLQLATLHAFNKLAIRRSMWTAHLPLSKHATSVIAPFAHMIRDMRDAMERRLLDEEMTVERRAEEMRYMSKFGRTAYVDEKLFRTDLSLNCVAGLFEEKESIPVVGPVPPGVEIVQCV